MNPTSMHRPTTKRGMGPPRHLKVKTPLVSGLGNAGALFGNCEDDPIHPQVLKMARKSGQLNLSNKGLNKIPHKVFTINDLDDEESKKLSENMKMDNSDGDKWWERSDLSKLYLNSNALNALDPLISQLSSLQVLDIGDNLLKELPSEIGELKCLSKLVLSHNDLVSLPESIGQLDGLRVLSLDHNNLKELPSQIGDLCMLEHLDVSHNQLSKLPSHFGYLQKLSKLCLADNKLSSLNAEVGDLFGLVHLDLSRNELTALPPSMCKMPKLREIYLRQNKFDKLPVIESSAIKEIYLGVNRIKKLSNEDLEPLSGLHVLDLCENGLEEIPDGVTYMQSIQRLDLVNNYISNLPYHLGFLPHLKSLTLEGNPLKLIQRDIIQRGTSQLLKYLSAKATQPINTYPGFSEFTPQVPTEDEIRIPDQYEMRNARAMVFSEKATEIPEKLFENASLAKVATADLSHNLLTQIPTRICELSSHLSDLILHHNKLTQLPAAIGELKHLQFLDVQNNLLTQLPAEFAKLLALREINMTFNKFQSLPESLLALPALEILFAGDNKITEIPVQKMSALTRLATLDLHNNDITFVPPELGRMTQLKCIQLEGNGFRVPRAAILAKGAYSLLEYLRSRIVE